MKKIILSLTLAVLTVLSAEAGSATWTISNGICSNLLSAPVRITSIIYQSSTTNTALFAGIDSPSTVLTNIVPSYSSITLKGTNYITSYTDFFGNSTLLTNFSLIHETNTVAAITNNFPTRFNLGAGTNSQVRIDNASYTFVEGFTVTNSGAGPVTITVGYQQ